MDEIEILNSVDSLTFSINIGDILKMKRYWIYDFLSPVEDYKRGFDKVNEVGLENLHYRNPNKPQNICGCRQNYLVTYSHGYWLNDMLVYQNSIYSNFLNLV